MSYTTQVLAEFVHRTNSETMPDGSRRAARQCLLDLLGAAVAAKGSPLAEITAETALKLFASGPATVWFTGGAGVQPAGAAMVNSAMASALDLDDGHRSAGGHPGAGIIPVALAVAQEVEPSGAELLNAVILGYEVAVRVGAARDFKVLDTLSTGRWCAYGAVAAAARLYGLQKELTAQALAIAGIQSPGLSAAGYSAVMGNQVKEGIPWASLTALISIELARMGFTGPLDILDHPDYYNRQQITADLGQNFMVERVYFKPYSCCRWMHAALDALFNLMERHRLMAEEIKALEVLTFERALRLNNYADPQSLEAAQYSLPFCLAAGAWRGRSALLPMTAGLLHAAEIVRLARNVRLETDAQMDKQFPDRTPARVVVHTPAGSYEEFCENPLGDPANPMSPAELEHKFKTLARRHLNADRQRMLISAIERLEQDGASALLQLLNDTA